MPTISEIFRNRDYVSSVSVVCLFVYVFVVSLFFVQNMRVGITGFKSRVLFTLIQIFYSMHSVNDVVHTSHVTLK